MLHCRPLYKTRGLGATSHRQPRQCRGGQGPKTVKWAQSDPNYVSRLLARSECLPGGAKLVTPLSRRAGDRHLAHDTTNTMQQGH